MRTVRFFVGLKIIYFPCVLCKVVFIFNVVIKFSFITTYTSPAKLERISSSGIQYAHINGHLVRTKIDLSWIDLRSISVRFEKVFTFFRSILDRSQFAFERSHSDRFGLRSISDQSNSLVWMASKRQGEIKKTERYRQKPRPGTTSPQGFLCLYVNL